MKKIDLHLHTFFSDGEDSPRELFNKIRKNNISLFSICDHNYISPESIKIKKIAEEYNIVFLQGVEISCVDRATGESLHILGYSHSFDLRKLNAFLQPIIAGYNRRAIKIIKKLNAKYNGLNLDFDEMRLRKKEAYISRNTIACELMKFLGEESITLQEALKETFVEESDSWMPDSKKAVRIIKDAGGVAIIAHPGRTAKNLTHNFEFLLKRLVKSGVIGLEAFYPKHDEQMTAYFNNLGRQYGLVITAGSDWHGENYTHGRTIGFEIADYEYIKILEMVQITCKSKFISFPNRREPAFSNVKKLSIAH